MRIAIDDRALADPTGIGRYARNLVKALPRVDSCAEYVLVGGGAPGMESYGMEWAGVRKSRFPIRSETGYEQLTLPRHISGLGVDVYHAMFTYVPLMADCAKVFTLHDLTPLLFPEFHRRETSEYLKRWTGMYVQAADAVIANSWHVRSDVLSFWPLAEKKTFVVLNAASERFRKRPVRPGTVEKLRSWGVNGDYVLYVGTLEPRKNVPRTIEAYGRLRDRHGGGVKLVLAGMRGWGREDLEKRIAEAGLEESVVMTGRVDDETLVDLYNGCLYFVYPSLYEGFGLPPLEALKCGKAVITSGVSSLPEVAGEAALYVEPESVDSIFCAMEKLLIDESLRAELEKRALEQAAKFSWEKSARSLKVIYRMYC